MLGYSPARRVRRAPRPTSRGIARPLVPRSLPPFSRGSVMMARGSRSTPEPQPLSDATVAALREAVLRLWNHPGEGDGPLHDAIAQTVIEARQRSLRAEDLILSFKDVLARLPELNASDRRLEAVRFRERLITLCIKAYYS